MNNQINIDQASNNTYGTFTLNFTGNGAGYTAGDFLEAIKTVTINGLGGKFIQIIDACYLNSATTGASINLIFCASSPAGTFNNNSAANITYATDVIRGVVPISGAVSTAAGATPGHTSAGLMNKIIYIDADTFYILPITQGAATINSLNIRVTYKIVQ